MVPELLAAGGKWISMPVDSKWPNTIVANAFRLRHLIASKSIRLVHARSRAPAWSSLWAARMAHIPFVTTHHGSYTAHGPFKRFYNSVMARGDAVIANSHWTAEHIRKQYSFAPARLVVIPRGIDFSRFDPASVEPERVARMRASWGAEDSDVVVLLPGRLTRWKGQEILIEAIAQLGNEPKHGTRAVLVGDSQGRDAYVEELKRSIAQKRLTDRVIIAGHVSEMPVAYMAADIVVSASTQEEAFGRVAAEASAMARAVIATDHGGARETILPGISGVLVRPGSAEDLARGLRELIMDGRAMREAMGAKGREYVARNFTLEHMCEDTIRLYRELLAG